MDYLKTTRHDAHQPLDVMVVGEALIDVVTTPHEKVEHPGGSPANVAYGLGRLGVTTGLLTAIGADARGASIENHLRSAGVILLPGSKSLTRTASATATLAPDGPAQYDFDISWELAPTAPAYFPKILHTGSIATFLSPGASVVKSLLEQAHKHCMITYDPNIRPAQAAVEDARNSGTTEPVTYPVNTEWKGYYIGKDESADWFYASGGISYSTQGQVTVYPPKTPGGEWSYSTDTTVSYRDRYNWDGTKSTDIGPVNTTDKQLGRLNEVGIAQNYNMTGESSTHHSSGRVK